MSDIAVKIVDGCFQLDIENGDLLTEQGLETAVLISLFSDQRINEEELPPGLISKRGWWGDLFADFEGDKIGSKIWILDRSKNSLETLAQLETYAKECLAWMITDGVASSIEVEGEIDEDNNQQINLSISITRPSGETDIFGIIWDEQNLKRA